MVRWFWRCMTATDGDLHVSTRLVRGLFALLVVVATVLIYHSGRGRPWDR